MYPVPHPPPPPPPPDSTSSADNPHHESQAPEQSQHESPAQQQSVPNTTAAPSQATDEGRIARLKRTRKDTEAILQSIVDQKAVDRSCDRDINSIVSKAMYGGKPYNATYGKPRYPCPSSGKQATEELLIQWILEQAVL